MLMVAARELIVVDGAGGVHVDTLHQLLHLPLRDGAALLGQALPQLLQRHRPALVHVQRLRPVAESQYW